MSVEPGSTSRPRIHGHRRLLLISEFFPPRTFGGGETSAFLLARGLAGRGFEVTVLTSKAEGLASDEKVEGFRVLRRLRTGYSPHSVLDNVRRVALLPSSIRRHATELSSRQAFDAVLLLNSTSVVPLALGVPTVAVINGYTPFCPKGNLYHRERAVCDGCNPGKFVPCIIDSEYAGLSRMAWYLRLNPLFWVGIYSQYRMRRRALASVDSFVAISGFVGELLHGHGVAAERIERIYNLAEIEDNDEVPEELAPIFRGRRVVTAVGSLIRVKGMDVAIRGFARWRSGSDVLLIVGDGAERPNLERLCSDLGVEEAVHFTGRLPPADLPFIYRSSYAIVAPSQWPEPFSRVVMEAAYHRRPLLASDRGGNRDLPAEHLFSGPEELATGLDDPPTPSFTPYDPRTNLDHFVRLFGGEAPAKE